ncbi:MAG: T9SS type A sorting domain-containing protein [Gemmatimonadales bacterium]|nr:T9SS type A sorting domain-containing protein [Gemmatimonadales bacterium]
MRKAWKISALLLLAPVLVLANTVTYDYEPVLTTYGTGTHIPGDYIFSEDLAKVFVDEFFIGGVPYFNFARIEPASAIFGNNQIMNLNNIDLVIDFTADGDVTFEYLDLGGSVNLQVNGFGTVLEAEDLVMLAGNVAPGVTMNVSVVPIAGGHRGVVTLIGQVYALRVGGQEFWVDGMFCDNGISSGMSGCDYEVTHESLALGKTWDGSTVAPGDWIFAEDGIDVTIHELDWGTGGLGFNYCRVEAPAVIDFGFNHTMAMNNVSNRYHISSLGILVKEVKFEFLDHGGMENLQVNGSTLFIGDLPTFPNNVAPGVVMTMVTYPVGSSMRAEVTLTGDVQDLLVGGQEFFIDEICVIKGEPLDCDHLVDHESLSVGDNWGTSSGHGPGDLAFVEDGVPVKLDRFDAGSGMFFNYCEAVPALSGLGTGRVMNLNNICNVYDISAVGAWVGEVTFEFLTYGGVENIQVNGAPMFVGDIELAPVSIAPGVTYTLTTYLVPGGFRGEVRLVGAVNELVLGGQEFYVDNICVMLNASSSVSPQMQSPSLVLNPNFPNPFNPRTTLSFSLEHEKNVRLTIHDVAGRLVKTLMSGRKSAGDHNVVWNGKDQHGSSVAAGIYFVRVATGSGEVQVQKIGLIK